MKTQTEVQIIARRLRELRAEMKENGIQKTSCFNGGMDRVTQRYNERRFALETELQTAKKKAVGGA